MSKPWSVHQRITVAGLSDDENDVVNELFEQLARKTGRNLLRAAYYDGKRALRQMSAVVPPQYNRLGIVLGWNATAVDLLARRCKLDAFAWPDGTLDDLGIDELMEANQVTAEAAQGVVSALIHATSFVLTTAGDPDEPDEPASLLQFVSALDATGRWNARTRRLDAFLYITERSAKTGRTTSFTLYLPDLTIDCVNDGTWKVEKRTEHRYGMLADPLPYRSRLKRPFGSSRITRAGMGLQDAAVRALIRLEGHMDVYAWPEFWMLGADASVFGDQARWQVMLGRIKGIPDDENAENPRADVKQFPAASPEPHLADINALSKLFARDMHLPDSSVAITDFANPTSADAYDSSQYDLIADAEGATDEWTPPLHRAVVRALAIQNGQPEIPDSWKTIQPVWRNPRFLSRAAEADAGMKQLTAVPWLAETTVGLQLLGLTPQQIKQAQGERQRARSATMLEQLAAAAPATAAQALQQTDAVGQ